jgi:hypothetical protein
MDRSRLARSTLAPLRYVESHDHCELCCSLGAVVRYECAAARAGYTKDLTFSSKVGLANSLRCLRHLLLPPMLLVQVPGPTGA